MTVPLSNLPGLWDWERRNDKWWRVHRQLNIDDGPHKNPRCHLCRLRIVIDPYGGSTAWVHLSKRAQQDHWAVP